MKVDHTIFVVSIAAYVASIPRVFDSQSGPLTFPSEMEGNPSYSTSFPPFNTTYDT